MIAADRAARRRGSAVLTTALLALAPTGAPAQESDAPVRVSSVEFEGGSSLGRSLLEDAIASRPTDCRSALAAPLCWLGFDRFRRIHLFDEDEAHRDVDRLETLYELWGFPDARVELRTERADQGVVLTYVIDEGLPIRVTELTLDAPPDLDMPEWLPLETGEPYALPLLDASMERIRHFLANQGHPYAAVAVGGSVDDETRSARLHLEVEPGAPAHFGTVTVDAGPPIDADVVRERLTLREGEPYSVESLQRSERLLYDLPAVGEAVIVPRGLSDSAAVVPVQVTVRPRRLRGVDVEGSVSSTDCLELAAFWTHRYFLDGPRLFSVGGSVDGIGAEALDGGFPCSSVGSGRFARVDYAARAELVQPLPGHPRGSATVEAFAERYSAPDVYVERAFGGTLGLSHRPSDDLALAVRYEPRRFELDAVGIYYCANYGVCAPEGVASTSGPGWLAPVGVSGVYRSEAELEGVQNFKLPRWADAPPPGLRLTLTGALEGAGAWSGSDHDYVRFIGQAAPARRFGDWELAGRGRFGLLEGDGSLPPQVRLYAGGPESVRGTAQNQLGPATLVVDGDALAELGCEPAAGGCPEGLAVDPEVVRIRPTGGSVLAEASVELRRWLGRRVQVAGFVDYGVVWSDAPWRDGDARSESLVSPGVGVRLMANIGAIRIDLAYDTRGARELPLHTGTDDGAILDLGMVRYAPYEHGEPGFFGELWRRLQLQFSVGQPY